MIAQAITQSCNPFGMTGRLDSGDRSEMLRVMLKSDGPGLVEVPELEVPRVAVYIGRPVRMDCSHGVQHHSGLAIHGDIDIIPDRIASRWEMKGADLALVLRVGQETIRHLVEVSGLKDVEIRSRFRVHDSQIQHIAWALMAEAENGYPSRRLYLDCMGTALALLILRNHSSVASHSPRSEFRGMPPKKLRQVQCFIEENLCRDLSLRMIADAAGLSTSHLKVTFRVATGIPVHQYVIQRRVERAAQLLREGQMPISRIAVEVGFAHQSHLALHMKRLLGASPRQMLNQTWPAQVNNDHPTVSSQPRTARDMKREHFVS
jgi:AraC family transcriptional regulator